MVEQLRLISESVLKPDNILDTVVFSQPQLIDKVAEFTSNKLQNGTLKVKELIDKTVNSLEKLSEIDKQAKLLTFLMLLEGKTSLQEGTLELLQELKQKHEFQDSFSIPFQIFISERLRIARNKRTRRGYENSEETRKIIELMKQNREFFYDIVLLQEHFTTKVSPKMPLNATWNPSLTQQFKAKNAAGLWYIYSHGLRAEYVSSMKEHFSSEWTGFNRFSAEPWQLLSSNIIKDGNMLDIGASIGISAVEIAQSLGIQGSIILLDYYNPYRNASSLRIIDYAQPQERFISIDEALRRMDMLRGERVIIQLFGVDIGEILSDELIKIIGKSSFVHIANTMPYIHRDKIYQTMVNTLQLSDEKKGIIRIHQDDDLPIYNILTSITVQRDNEKCYVLRDLTKIK